MVNISINEAASIQACHNVLLLTASTFPYNKNDFSEKDIINYPFGKENQVVSGIYQLEPVPKMLAKIGYQPDLIVVMASNATQTSKSIIYNNVDMEISPIDFFIKRLTEDTDYQFKDKSFCVISTQEKEKDRLVGAISDVVYIFRKIKESNADCKFYLDTHGGMRQDQENLNAITNLLELENIEFTDIFNVSGVGKPIVSIKNTRIYDFTAGIKEFVNFGRSKSIEGYLEGKSDAKESKLHKIIQKISDALTLCNVELFEKGLDELNEALGDDSSEHKSSDNYMDIFIDTIRNSYEGLLDPRERNLATELGWAIKHGFIQQALALVESKSARFFLQYVIDSKPYNNASDRGISVEEYYRTVAEKHEEITNVLFAPVVFKNPKITTDTLIEKEHCSRKSYEKYNFYYPFDRVFYGKIELIKKGICEWTALKKIRNHVMHSNGMKAKDFLECNLFRDATKNSTDLMYAGMLWKEYSIEGITKKEFEAAKTRIPDITMEQVMYILEEYLKTLNKIIEIGNHNVGLDDSKVDAKMQNICIETLKKKSEYKMLTNVFEAQIVKFASSSHNTFIKILNSHEGCDFGGSGKDNNGNEYDGFIATRLCNPPYNKQINDRICVKMLKNESNRTLFEFVESSNIG